MTPRATENENSARFCCDLVVPVYNGLTYVRDCIESILRWSGSVKYRLILIDDCSDSYTRDYLKSVKHNCSNILLHINRENLGYVKSCNMGIAMGDAPYVVLINSDVVVTPGWLERLLECADSDPRIGSVNPLTNYASQINVPLAPGASFIGMDRVVREKSVHSFPDVVTGVGFCLLLRRAALNEVGVFDEVYGHGYCEESDLCMRLTTSGWRTVVADHVYIYHKGRGTFQDRDERYRHNRAIFDSRWKNDYKRQFHVFRKDNPLAPTRALFQTPLRWTPKPMVWETARGMLREWNRGAWMGVAEEAVRGSYKVLCNQIPVATSASVAKVTYPGRLRVTYVLRDIVVAGGVLSVIQLVNELILLGVEARIVAIFEDPLIYNWTRLYTRPIIFRSHQELVEQFPDSDIAVATLWSTAPWVDEIVRKGRARTSVYFIQDYEPWFFPEKNQTARNKVSETYSLIEHRIVKSNWLKEMLAQHGCSSKKILLGMDLGRFYPRDVAKKNLSILAMARLGTPYRGFKPTIAALALVKQAMPDVEVILFGSRGLSNENIPFVFRDEGVVVDQDHLARLYSEADVFLDGSDFQGFGRCGLEAMACGAACVLTGVGGITEYARDGENTLAVPPKSPELFATAVVKLLSDPVLRNRLIEGGAKTVHEYCHKREARDTLAYFHQIGLQSQDNARRNEKS